MHSATINSSNPCAMDLILDKKVLKKLREPLLTEEERKSYSPDKKELEKLQNAYLSTFKNAEK